jgi:hypothetical protein
LISVFLICFALAAGAGAQTSAFSYQGRLTDKGAAANGTYQMTFALFDAATAGTQQGATIANNSVTVASGIFTVQLDFSPATPFAAGADRWLEIAVKNPLDPGFTKLSPRQQITASPYAIRTLSAGFADTATTAVTAGTATSFTGNLAGDVTGTQGSTVVSSIRGKVVSATAPTDNQVLTFSTGSDTWAPATPTAAPAIRFARLGPSVFSAVGVPASFGFATATFPAAGQAIVTLGGYCGIRPSATNDLASTDMEAWVEMDGSGLPVDRSLESVFVWSNGIAANGGKSVFLPLHAVSMFDIPAAGQQHTFTVRAEVFTGSITGAQCNPTITVLYVPNILAL